jgi:hypothetical protein
MDEGNEESTERMWNKRPEDCVTLHAGIAVAKLKKNVKIRSQVTQADLGVDSR